MSSDTCSAWSTSTRIPSRGIKWHEQAVYDALAKPPNSWDHDTTYHNILEKLALHTRLQIAAYARSGTQSEPATP